MQHRAVAAVREWNARLGQDATYLICSHGDVIKAIVADSLGLHLDQCQRIQADPCSLTVIRYTPLRPFLLRMNDRGGGVDDLLPHADGHGHARGRGRHRATRRSGAARAVRISHGQADTVTGAPVPRQPGYQVASRRRTREDRTMPVYFYDPPDRFVAGAVGQPGERIFYLQATSSGRVTSVVLEKFQVSLLAERIDELLDEVLRRTGGSPRCPPPPRPRCRTTRRSTCRCSRTSGWARSRWPGTATVAWWSSRRRRNRTSRWSRWPRTCPPTARGCCGSGSRRARPARSPSAPLKIVAAGRPPCPLCGLPLDADGHICPRQNGHRVGHA